MSSEDWTSVPKDAYNWIADGLPSYCAAMKEIIDNTFPSGALEVWRLK